MVRTDGQREVVRNANESVLVAVAALMFGTRPMPRLPNKPPRFSGSYSALGPDQAAHQLTAAAGKPLRPDNGPVGPQSPGTLGVSRLPTPSLRGNGSAANAQRTFSQARTCVTSFSSEWSRPAGPL